MLIGDARAARRALEFFTAHIRNPHTRKAYAEAAAGFADWCGAHGVAHLRDVEPVHVAAHVEDLQLRMAAPSVKLRLAGLRMLFDWLVVGPKHSVRKGKTPVLTAAEPASCSIRS